MDYIDIISPWPPIGSGVPRTTGRDVLHLTDVIHYIEVKLNIQYKGDWKADMHLTMDVGFLWEHVLELAYADRVAERIGEITEDSIIGSPDGVGIDEDIYDTEGNRIWRGTGELVLEEYKATWKSVKTLPGNVWRYLVQIKSYCYMLGLTICVMRIVYLMGDYRGSGPLYKVARFSFTQQELQDNWNMILTNAEDLRKDQAWWATRPDLKGDI